MKLVRGVDADARRRAICRGVINICRDLGIRVIAEGIETEDELSALRDLGISLVQGYLFAKPKVGSLHQLASGAPR
jgi:EAL domain-containing protein (putative c-di-GMP-specific phosphodiesterase class I)